MKGYYKILGVKKNASGEEIRARWAKLMRKLHPDRVEDEGANSKRIREINEAYEILKHSSTRVKYDLKRAYDRRKRRSRILKVALPMSLVIVPVILASFYLYVRMPQVSSLSKRINENGTNQINQKNQIGPPSVEKTASPIEKTPPVLEPKPSIKIAEMVPNEVKQETSKEVKKVIAQEMVKVVPMTPPSAPGEELESRGKPSTQTILKSEIPVPTEKVVPKEMSEVAPQEMAKIVPQTNQIRPEGFTALRPRDSIDATTPKRIDSVDTKGVIDSKTQLTQQRIDPIDAKTESTQLTQRSDGPGERISPKSSIAEEEEVRQFFAKYVERYIQKDLDGFLSLFSSKAVQNQKEGFEETRKVYANFFNQTQQLQYQMGDLKIQIHQNTVEAKACYEVDQTLKKRGKKKVWKGPIRWTLVKEQGALKIFSIDYLHQKGS